MKYVSMKARGNVNMSITQQTQDKSQKKKWNRIKKIINFIQKKDNKN